jgi:excisionase family DNA binding protein
MSLRPVFDGCQNVSIKGSRASVNGGDRSANGRRAEGKCYKIIVLTQKFTGRITREMEFLTTEQAAEKLGVTIRRVQAVAQSGRLPARRFGRALMIRNRISRWLPIASRAIREALKVIGW